MQEGRELVIASRVERPVDSLICASTRTWKEDERKEDVPIYGDEAAPPPVSGWIQARGVVRESTPNNDASC